MEKGVEKKLNSLPPPPPSRLKHGTNEALHRLVDCVYVEIDSFCIAYSRNKQKTKQKQTTTTTTKKQQQENKHAKHIAQIPTNTSSSMHILLTIGNNIAANIISAVAYLTMLPV